MLFVLPLRHWLRIQDCASYSWFSHDVTKIQTKKLSFLLSFYFHVVLEHLKTFKQTNFRFKRVVCFAIKDSWISRLLCNTAFSWQLGKLSCGLNTLQIVSSSSEEFTHKEENLTTDVSVVFRRPYLCPWKGHKHGVSLQSVINLGKTFFWISHIWTIA